MVNTCMYALIYRIIRHYIYRDWWFLIKSKQTNISKYIFVQVNVYISFVHERISLFILEPIWPAGVDTERIDI